MIKPRLFVFIIGCVGLLAGCGSHVHHQVRKGETLYSISWRYQQNYQDVAKWNAIEPPYLIHPGQWIRVVPVGRAKTGERVVSASAPLRDYSSSSSKQPIAVADKLASAEPVPVKPSTSVNFSTNELAIVDKTKSVVSSLSSRFPVKWQWPTKGVIVHPYNAKSLGKKGLAISAERGAPIYAAAAGKVVYSGSGLKGYGNLVIIKHNDKYLSAYGHNRNLLVKDGDYVKKGQVIARMGDTESNGVKLHFEIRVDGKPQDPVRYLPKLGT